MSLLVARACLGAPVAPEIASFAAVPTTTGGSGSFAPQFSADGRFMVFLSTAGNLVTNDDKAPWLDIFVRNLVDGGTTLVSVNTSGIGGGTGDSLFPSISSNGQFVAFASAAPNLVSNDTNDASDVFVRDVVAGITRLISVTPSGHVPAHAPARQHNVPLSRHPLISANGRWVFFESLATNLVPATDTNGGSDIFVRDLATDEMSLISLNAFGTASANAPSELSSVTPDGRFVAFISAGSDIAPGATNGIDQVYVRDIQFGVTYWATSHASRSNYPGGPAPGRAGPFYGAVLSDNGRFVFASRFESSLGDGLWQVELETLNTRRIDYIDPGETASVSSDARYVAYQFRGGIYLWDRTNQMSNLIRFGTHSTISADGSTLAFLSNSVAYTRGVGTSNDHLASITLNGGTAPASDIGPLALTPDGQKAGFVSSAPGIVERDYNGAPDVFVHNVLSNVTELVSQSVSLEPLNTGNLDSGIRSGCVSADGRRVVLSRHDQASVALDTNRWRDVYASDIETQTSFPVSVMSNGMFRASYLGEQQVISGDGQYAAFVWRPPSTGLSSPSPDQNIYRRHLASAEILAVSVRAGGTNLGNGLSGRPVLNSNGQLVAFQSQAWDLVFDLPNARPYVVLRDMLAGTNRWLGKRPPASDGSAEQPFREEIEPLFTPDDRWVLFAARGESTANYFQYQAYDRVLEQLRSIPAPFAEHATGLVVSANSRFIAFYTARGLESFRHDLLSSAPNTLICSECLNPSLSGDGSLAAYESQSSSSPFSQILVRNLGNAETTLVSVGRNGGYGNGHSRRPIISPDGRFIVFVSIADNLLANDEPGTSDIFVRDRLLGVTFLLSRSFAGPRPGNAASMLPFMAADGRTVVFESFAGDLASGDLNFSRDVFVVRLAGADSDSDALDDDWEVAYFGNLNRDGRGDFDNDGQSDRTEFLAGTDPTNQESIFRVLTITAVETDRIAILWAAVPGRTYQVQYKANADDPEWMNLGEAITAPENTASQIDTSPGFNHRFYRVVRVP